MITPPTIATLVLYITTETDMFARGRDYLSEDPVSAIVTKVTTPEEGPVTVNLTLFPDGRTAFQTRENVLHRDDVAAGQPYFLLLTDSAQPL